NDTEHPGCRDVICLGMYDFLLLRARCSQSELRLLLVVCHSGDNPFRERMWKMNRIAPKRAFGGREQGLSCGSEIAFGQRVLQPKRGDLWYPSRISRSDVIDHLAQRLYICFPIHFYESALCFCREIVWFDSQYAIEIRFLFS